MAKQKLNLLQLAAGGTAEASATSSQVMGCQSANADFGGELLNNVPDQLFRYSFAPNSTGAADTPEKAARGNTGGPRPVIQ